LDEEFFDLWDGLGVEIAVEITVSSTTLPNHSVSSMVNSLKGVSSRLLRIKRPDIEKRYWNNVL
jgi:hypothetical protein